MDLIRHGNLFWNKYELLFIRPTNSLFKLWMNMNIHHYICLKKKDIWEKKKNTSHAGLQCRLLWHEIEMRYGDEKKNENRREKGYHLLL